MPICHNIASNIATSLPSCGASVPVPYGGKPRQIMVDIDGPALFAKGLSATDVSLAINAQNLVLPAGTAKLGAREYNVRLNSSPDSVAALNDLPIKQVGNTTIYLRDVAQVLSEYHVNILSCTSQTSTDRVAKFRFDFELADPNHLESILWAVKRVESVYAAYRVLPGHAKLEAGA